MTSTTKICKKCFGVLQVYVSCYECDALYHVDCLTKLPGFFLNEEGLMFCCWSTTSKYCCSEKDVRDRALKEKQRALANLEIRNKDVDDCEDCGTQYHDYCSKCGYLIHILDTSIEMGTKNRAKETVPKNIFEVRELSTYNYGVFALKTIPKGIQIGPLEGLQPVLSPKGRYAWRIRCGKLVDVRDEKYSNWLRYVNGTNDLQKLNLIPFQNNQRIYYRTIKEIQIGEELLAYYGKSSGKSLGVDIMEYFCPDTQEVKESVCRCDPCSFGFSNEKFLTIHNRVCPYKNKETITVNDIFVCIYCKTIIFDEPLYEEHKTICKKRRLHLNEEVDPLLENKKLFQCKQCGYKTPHSYRLKRHLPVHNEDRYYQCSHCKKGKYKRNEMLLRHIELHHKKKDEGEVKPPHIDIKKEQFNCNDCSYVTTSKTSLYVHKLKHREGPKRFQCEHCDYSTWVKDVYVRHLRVHTQEKPFKCSYEHCNYKCAAPYTLKMHVKYSHMTEKPFKCDMCNYRFTAKGNLKAHIERIHGGFQRIMEH